LAVKDQPYVTNFSTPVNEVRKCVKLLCRETAWLQHGGGSGFHRSCWPHADSLQSSLLFVPISIELPLLDLGGAC